ncbi:MAG: glycosyltransferase family 39 protein, partial [Candidatus Latescibacteria bacterium]|nr:glycosyltransferase family 39 protein [Candidatus Latescibacterota bacterium]
MAPLALIGALALALRIWALDFGLPSGLHPDEFSFVFIPLNFFSGDLNPHFFTYPTFHYYLLALVYLGCFTWEYLFGAGLSLEHFIALHYFWERGQLLELARWVSALYGAATVVWAGLLARRVFGARAGWMAACWLAVGVVHLRQSYLAGVDAAMTCFFVGAVWAAVRILQRDGMRDYVLAGGLVGLAAACKYPGALAGIAVVAAHLLARRSPLARGLWLSGAAALGVFAFSSPYVLLDFGAFESHFSAQVAQMERGRGEIVGRGWLHHLRFSLPV